MSRQVSVSTHFVLRIKPDTIREHREIKVWVPIPKSLMIQPVKKQTHELPTPLPNTPTQREESTAARTKSEILR